MKQDLIYRLRIKRRRTAAMYPSFHIHDAELFFYPTKEAAEDKIRGFGWEPDLYCFIIEACPYNRDVTNRAYRRWVYDDEGVLISAGRILPGPSAGSVSVQTRRYCRICLQ